MVRFDVNSDDFSCSRRERDPKPKGDRFTIFIISFSWFNLPRQM
jgi:hypothetical protein